jgi:hypothetical protein
LQLNRQHYACCVLKNPYFQTKAIFRCKVISMRYVKMNGRVDCSIYYSRRGCDLSTSALSLTPTRYNGRCKSWRRANANQFAEADVVAPSELEQILGRELSSPACLLFGFGLCPGWDFSHTHTPTALVLTQRLHVKLIFNFDAFGCRHNIVRAR